MAKAAVSDDQFVELWHAFGSATKLANHLGQNARSVNARRRAIEARRKVSLLTLDEQRPSYNQVRPRDHEAGAVATLRIDNGTILVGSDAHIWPGPLTTMQRAFLHFARKLKPTVIVANGDFFDGARVSRFPSIGWESRPSIRQELEAVSDYMGDLTKAAATARRFWPLGNHDARFESRIANTVPEVEGVKGMHLKDHIPGWTPCWRLDVNDDAVIRHREFGGEHADWNNVVKGGKTIVTGHDHRTGVVPYRNYRGLHWGVRCGFLGDSPTDPQFVHYLEAREPNWHPAFVVLTFVGGRLLWPELVTRHDDDAVEFRGAVVRV